MSRSNSNKSETKKSHDSASSSPDITTRAPQNIKTNGSTTNINNNNNNNNHRGNNMNNSNNNGQTATMSETSDDSSLNSVELDPMGKASFTVQHTIHFQTSARIPSKISIIICYP